MLSYRYDVIPDELVLNNTLQIVYNASNPPAASVEIQAAAVLDDTEFVPILQREMVGKTVEYRLDAYFDVSNPFPLHWRQR
jgi:iron transport multicopper oxidase